MMLSIALAAGVLTVVLLSILTGAVGRWQARRFMSRTPYRDEFTLIYGSSHNRCDTVWRDHEAKQDEKEQRIRMFWEACHRQPWNLKPSNLRKEPSK